MHYYITDKDWEKLQENFGSPTKYNLELLRKYFGVNLQDFVIDILNTAEREMVEVQWEK